MAKKKTPAQNPPAQTVFKTNPFAALKGVAVAAPQPETPQKQPVKPVAPPREPSADDLFLQAMAGVRPLAEDPAAQPRKPVAAKAGPAAAGSKPAAKPALPRDEVLARKAFLHEVAKLKLDVRFEDNLPQEDELRPLAGNRLRQVRRGVVRLDRQLDLHGLTREEALDALERFLQAARRGGEKAVLVITGQGRHSAEGPVLQQAVAAWLREQGRELVLEYAPAPRELGGGGALVVFVRPLDKPVKE